MLDLTKDIRDICKRDKTRLDFAWVDQITRASISIMANIAEGFEAQSDVEFATFLGYAKRSSAEVRSLLYYRNDQSYLTKE
ncbi:four helix bundle protein [Patescibacteria group bacterium]|nr:four helix bundle protein [Patescibacteria group bacterium]